MVADHRPGVVTGALSCPLAREAVSAAADDEDPGVSNERLAAHLDHCPGCTGFAAEVGHLRRALSVRTLETPPSSSDLLAVLGMEPPTGMAARARARWRRARRRSTWRRAGEWAVGVVPLAAALPVLALHGIHPGHVVPLDPTTACTAALRHLWLHR